MNLFRTRPSTASAAIASIGGYSIAFLSLTASTKLLDGAVQHSIERSFSESTSVLIFLGSISVLWTLFSSALALLLTAKALGLRPSLRFRDFELLCIETLRSVAAATIRFPLFVIPALYEWLRLAPVTFVVLLHAPYGAGNEDALSAARSLFRKFPVRVSLLTGLTVLFSLGTTLLETPLTSEHPPLWEAPQQYIVSILLLSAAQFAVNWFLLKTYLRMFSQLTNTSKTMSNKA